VQRYGPDKLLDLTRTAITERARAFRELAAIPTLVPLEKQLV
jgi:hypothetical protein